MVFESVRGYVELASGLGDLTRARALEAAQGLLTLPATSKATGNKVAMQASALADELLAAATANRSNLTMLVRAEVDAAIGRLGLVTVQRLEEAQAEAAALRAEVARLSSASPQDAPRSTPRETAASESKAAPESKAAAPESKAAAPESKAVAPKSTARKAASKSTTRKAASKSTTRKAASKSTTRKAASKTAKKAATPGRSAVTTRVKPAGT